MLIAQWILEITDILINKIVSFWKKSVIKKNFARLRPYVPTALIDGSSVDI